MKRVRIILIAVILVTFTCLPGQLAGQEKSKEEKERELRMQQELDAQKKAMAEQKKAQMELQEALEIQQKDVEKALKDAQDEIDAASKLPDHYRMYRTGRPLFEGEPFVWSANPESFYGLSYGGDSERTTWDFSRSVKEKSFSRDYTFDVESTVKTVVMSVNGDCKAGDIRIKIIMPNGKVYSDIVIDEFGNLNWRKSFTISEEENKDKAGAWKFQISAAKATGYFKISLQTY